MSENEITARVIKTAPSPMLGLREAHEKAKLDYARALARVLLYERYIDDLAASGFGLMAVDLRSLNNVD